MATCAEGDVGLVATDFTDRTERKPRPAVVISGEDYNRRTPDGLIASATGNLGAVPHPVCYRIGAWKAAGLLKPSLARTKLATVASSGIRRNKLGRLGPEDLSAFSRGLREALSL